MINGLKKFDVEQILDGSTFIGWINLELDIKIRKKIRLINVRCHNTNVEQGLKSKEFVQDLLEGKNVYCNIFKDRFHKYSTVLAVVYIQSGERDFVNLNDLLVEKNLGIKTVKSDGSDSNNERV